MVWEWFKDADDVIDSLSKEMKGVSVAWDERLVKRYNELIEKVAEFEKEYFRDSGDVLLGYAVVYKGNDIFVKAMIARGEKEPHLELIDIEEWLREYNSDP
jgi:hypothetical protein